MRCGVEAAKTQAMRIIYFGSGEFGLPTLRWLVGTHEVVQVVTQPDRPAGRHRHLTATPIGAWAAEHSLPVLKAEDVNQPEVVEAARALNADAAVVIAFGQKLSEALIEAAGRLVVNLHASLLPRYRGAAPINHAMLNCERETGVSVISLAQRMDAGMIYAQASLAIDPRETAGELHDRLAELGPGVMERVLRDFQAGTLVGQKQDESQATRAPKLSKADGWVDFSATAEQVRCRIHGLTPWPGVRVLWRSKATGREQELLLRRVADEPNFAAFAPPGTVLEGLRIATGNGAIQLLEVQPPGKPTMAATDFARGHAITPGDQFISPSPAGRG